MIEALQYHKNQKRKKKKLTNISYAYSLAIFFKKKIKETIIKKFFFSGFNCFFFFVKIKYLIVCRLNNTIIKIIN
jgi:hypothetical protein